MGGVTGSTKFDKDKCASQIRQSILRMNIHRQKKLSKIAQTKDDICKHLKANNEVNAKIWTETLINDEALVPCYDVASTMCDQVKGRLEYINKQGPPKDMNQTFATLIHVAPKLDVEELTKVRKQLVGILGKEFAEQADEDKSMINPVVAAGIDFKIPSDGEVVYRMRVLAKERNIQYTPSFEMQSALNSYLDMKGLQDPFNEGQAPQQNMGGGIPQYNPGMVVVQQQQQVVPMQPGMIVQPMVVPQYYDPSQPPVQPMMPVHQPPANMPPVYQPPSNTEFGGDPQSTNIQDGNVVQPPDDKDKDDGPPSQPPSMPPTMPPSGPPMGGPVDISDLEARFRALEGN